MGVLNRTGPFKRWDVCFHRFRNFSGWFFVFIWMAYGGMREGWNVLPLSRG
jgi:hypothetical protein